MWKPAFVRRSLGTAIVEACARGRFRAPAEAAGPVLEAALAAWRRTGWRTYHWEPWVAGLAGGARAAVLGEAVTWATVLWSSFEWAAMDGRAAFDSTSERWSSASAPGVLLTARAEMRLALRADTSHPTDTPPLALVSVHGGTPPPDPQVDVAHPALVAALCAPSRPVPARSVGLWPDAGHVECADIDIRALDAAVDRVVSAVRRLSAHRRGRTAPSEGAPEVAAPARC